MFQEAGFEEIRVVALPPDARAKGPGLFVATAQKQMQHEDTKTRRRNSIQGERRT
jgi:hypothetical protein